MSNLDDTDDQSPSTYTGLSLSTTGELAVVVLFMTFLLFVITLIFYFRARRYMGITNASPASRLQPRRHRRLMFAPSQTASSPYCPLDPSVLKSLSVTAFRSEDRDAGEAGGLDCAVCLSEFTDGEEARLLPKCSHRFHVECIDMWFRSNSTCPLCRLPVGPAPVTVKPLSLVLSRKDSPPSIATSFDNGSTSSTTGSSSTGRETPGMIAIDMPIEYATGGKYQVGPQWLWRGEGLGGGF